MKRVTPNLYISNTYINLTFDIHVHVKYIHTNSCTHKDMNVYTYVNVCTHYLQVILSITYTWLQPLSLVLHGEIDFYSRM